jgi:hypothetical protein
MFLRNGQHQEWLLGITAKDRNVWIGGAKLNSEEQVLLLTKARRFKQMRSRNKKLAEKRDAGRK